MTNSSTLADRAEALLRASDALDRPRGAGATVTRHQTAAGGDLAVATRTRASDGVAVSFSLEFYPTSHGVRCVAVLSDDDGRPVASLGDFALADTRAIDAWLVAVAEIGWTILHESTDPRGENAVHARKD